ncbi:MAG TPA: glycosyltransferase family 2 protein [Terriglobales bacterium]|nr:glycosyltransferase family 2 protein [Terriglobales bacterium]
MLRLPMVSVLICTFNSAQVLPNCLRSLFEQDYASIEVVIVDNASSDGTQELLSQFSGRLPHRIVLNDKNVGFSAAQNQALHLSRGEWVLTLNPDVVLSPNFISELLQAAHLDPKVGSLCGKLLRWQPGAAPEFTKKIDSTGMYFVRNLRHFDRGSEQPDSGQYESLEYVFGATGAAALFRRAMVEDVSVDAEFFDQDFFAYREDADLAWRAQLMGWRCLYVPSAIGWHERRVTPARFRELPLSINWHSVKNRFLMRMKNVSGGTYLRLFIPVTARDLLIVGYCLLADQRLVSAFWFVWKNRRRTWRKRKQIQARRRVEEPEIRWWFNDQPTSRAFDKGGPTISVPEQGS